MSEFSDEQRGELIAIITDVSKHFLQLNAKQSGPSVKISRTTAGKVSFEIKVYADDIVTAANECREVEAQIAREYLNIEPSGCRDVRLEGGQPPPATAPAAAPAPTPEAPGSGIAGMGDDAGDGEPDPFQEEF